MAQPAQGKDLAVGEVAVVGEVSEGTHLDAGQRSPSVPGVGGEALAQTGLGGGRKGRHCSCHPLFRPLEPLSTTHDTRRDEGWGAVVMTLMMSSENGARPVASSIVPGAGPVDTVSTEAGEAAGTLVLNLDPGRSARPTFALTMPSVRRSVATSTPLQSQAFPFRHVGHEQRRSGHRAPSAASTRARCRLRHTSTCTFAIAVADWQQSRARGHGIPRQA